MASPVIVWLRQDLRLADQAAFLAAAGEGAVIPLYVLDDDGPGAWAIGGAQRWWLHHSLDRLAGDLARRGSKLILRRGSAAETVAAVAEQAGARRVHAIRHYEPWWIAAEEALGARVELVLHDGNQLAPPRSICTGGGEPYKIFSSFWRALSRDMPPPAPEPAPATLDAPARWPESDRLSNWVLLPTKPDWAKAFADDWQPGEAGAHERLEQFAEHVGAYETRRNLPGDEGTSRLSPHLHHGEISPASVWRGLARRKQSEAFLRELAWRDFSAGMIRQRPDYGDANGRARFDRLEWRTGRAADADFDAWTQGRTGYPIVDAGMRQLWATGWMHNRVRMIAASFVVKHLLIDWRRGERWFWDTLVDADFGDNSVNWQWIAGTGTDANMFGRIMAPLTQSAKFDAGDYVRRWVPELAGLADADIHDPHGQCAAPDDYPKMRIGHREGRERALAAGRTVRAG